MIGILWVISVVYAILINSTNASSLLGSYKASIDTIKGGSEKSSINKVSSVTIKASEVDSNQMTSRRSSMATSNKPSSRYNYYQHSHLPINSITNTGSDYKNITEETGSVTSSKEPSNAGYYRHSHVSSDIMNNISSVMSSNEASNGRYYQHSHISSNIVGNISSISNIKSKTREISNNETNKPNKTIANKTVNIASNSMTTNQANKSIHAHPDSSNGYNSISRFNVSLSETAKSTNTSSYKIYTPTWKSKYITMSNSSKSRNIPITTSMPNISSNYVYNTTTSVDTSTELDWYMFPDLSYHSPCDSGNAEVVQSFTLGWKGTSNTGFGWVVGDMIFDIANNEKNGIAANDFTATTTRGGLKCGAWMGAMVSNGDTFSYLAQYMRDNVRTQDIPTGKYFEYVSSDGDPMKTFGLYCQVNSGTDDVGAALRGWSEAKSASQSVSGVSGTWSFGQYSICYKSYGGRKSGNLTPDGAAGKCNTGTINQGQTASSVCNVPGDSLSYYNKGIDFSSLSPGDIICCSIGDGEEVDPVRDYKCNSSEKKIVDITLGWKNINTNNDIGWVVADMASDIMTFFKNNPTSYTSFATRGNLMCASWSGAMISITDSINSLLPMIRDNFKSQGLPDGKYFEYIGEKGNAFKVFGLYCSMSGKRSDLQAAIKGWSEGKAASEAVSGVSGTWPVNHNAMCFTSYANRRSGNTSPDPNIGQCDYKRVQNGQSAVDTCYGISGDILSHYNSININVVQPNQPICCSIGDMPDFRPKPNSDGSCYYHQFEKGDTCSAVMAQYYPLSMDDLMKYNKDTFGWMGCDGGHPWLGDKVCLSSGTPPRPTVNPMAECGPQAPGDKYNAKCPLNACCSQYGFCGLDEEFCGTKKSPTNAPGTTGCLSNCEPVNFAGYSNSWTRISYFDGTKQDSVLNYGDEYDVIHLAFANIAKDHNSIDVSNLGNNYNDFKNIKAKKVLSVGGWDFSTDPTTYEIFRDGIENDYDHFANVIVSFMQQEENSFLDGFDIDWEYPGEPDIPGIPADNKDAGNKYLELIKAVRLRMSDSKTLSMAIPSSYWYLKNFPIVEMSQYVDYFVFMSYDLHGQWDYSEKFSGGPHTSCHTNYVETVNALKMIVKAGVPESKIRVGIANYARTYKLAEECNGEGCEFLGPQSQAEAGKYTNTPGILSITEIREIVADQSRVNSEFNNASSECTYLRYDNDQWAAWTTENSVREQQYRAWGFGGSSLWVANYEKGTTNPSDADNGDDEETEDDFYNEFLPIATGYSVYPDLIDASCWFDNKDISTDKEYNNLDQSCALYGTLAYVMNKANEATNYFEKILTDSKENKSYTEDYKGYSSYFAHNMSHAYQDWSYASLGNDTWFSCLNDKGEETTCLDAYYSNYKPPCYQNCCNNIGCSKKDSEGQTVQDPETDNNKCKQESVMDSCCTQSNYYSPNPDTSELNNLFNKNILGEKMNLEDTSYNPIKIKRINKFRNIINYNTIQMLRTGYKAFGDSGSEKYHKNRINKRFYHDKYTDHTTISGWKIIEPIALANFSRYVGYTINMSEIYTQSFYRYQIPAKNDPEHICFTDQHNNVTVRCYDLPKDQLLHKDPMQYINMKMLYDIRNLIDNMRSAIENFEDYPDEIYSSSIPPLMQFIDNYDSILSIRRIGHNYSSRCERLRVMEILQPLLIALSVLTMIFDPVPALISDLALTIIGITIDPDHDPASIALQLAGSLAGIFGVIGKTDKARFGKIGKNDKENPFNLASKTYNLVSSKMSKEACKL